MRFNPSDRVRVSRVRVNDGKHTREIRSCWISVNADRNQLGIWLEDQDPRPAMMVPLADAQIEWKNETDLPLPAPPAC